MKTLLDNLEELGFGTQIQLEEFMEYFRSNYGHVYDISLSDKQVIDFLKQDFIRRSSIESKADSFYDYIMSQGLCDYYE